MQHHLHWPAHCSADDAEESWLRTRSSIQIHRPLVPLGLGPGLGPGLGLGRPRVNSAIYISASADCQKHGGGGGGGGSARTLAASLLASGLARPWARRARSAENIPLHAARHGAAGDDQDDAEEEEAAAAAEKRRRKRRRGQYEMPVLSVSGPSPPGDSEELEQHL